MLFVNAAKCLNQVKCVSGELNKNENKNEVLSEHAINSHKKIMVYTSIYSQPRNLRGHLVALYQEKEPPSCH
jgi:hypothetical protein